MSDPKLPAERPSDVAASSAAPKPETKKIGERPPSGRFRKTLEDPGAARGLPPPLAARLHGGERVRLTRAQDYADRRVEAGAEGIAMYPSSQAACWVVLFLSDGMMRVVPNWDLELLEPAKVH